MVTIDDIRKRVAGLYDLRGNKDLSQLVALLHPEGTFQIAGSKALAPYTNKVKGRDQLAQFLAALVKQWDLSGMAAHRIVIEGNTIAAWRKGVILHVPTGRHLETQMVDMITLRDGLAIDYALFVDTLGLVKTASTG